MWELFLVIFNFRTRSGIIEQGEHLRKPGNLFRG